MNDISIVNKLSSRPVGDNERISKVIAFHIYFMACKNMLVSTSALFYKYNDRLNLLSAIIIGIVYLYILFKSHALKIPKITIIVVILFAIFVMITYLYDPIRFTSDAFPYSYVKIQTKTFLIYCFPLFFCISTLDNTDYLVATLYKYVTPTFIFATIAFIFKLIDNRTDYSMSYGYAAIWVFIVSLFKYIKQKNIRSLLISITTAFYIFIAASRGPLVSIMVAMIIALLLERPSKKKIIIVILIIVIGLVFILFGHEILTYISQYLKSINVSSRTVDILIKDNIAYSQDRTPYHQAVLDALSKSPFIGLGAFGGEATTGLTHGLFLDIYANFGYVFGTLYLAFICYILVNIITKNMKNTISELLLILAVVGLPIGFFESGFWVSKELWMIMGLIISYKKTKIYNNSGVLR